MYVVSSGSSVWVFEYANDAYFKAQEEEGSSIRIVTVLDDDVELLILETEGYLRLVSERVHVDPVQLTVEFAVAEGLSEILL